MELRYGDAILIGSSGSILPINAAFRVTLHVRADPLNAVSGRSKPARDGRIKTSHFEVR